MNPIQIIRLLGLLNQSKAITREKGSFMSKFPQYIHLLVTLCGVIGVPTLAHDWLSQPAHASIFAAIVGISVLLHAISPGIFGGPTDEVQKTSGIAKVGVILFMLLTLPSCGAQNVLPVAPATGLQNLYAAGASYSINAKPGVAGTGLYAHLVAGTGTYAFTAVDALPNTTKPFTVTSNIGVGIAQKLTTVGKVGIYLPTAAGISWSGANTGWQWNGGAAATIPLKNGYLLMPTVRFLKSSVSGGTGYQPIFGILFGWGK